LNIQQNIFATAILAALACAGGCGGSASDEETNSELPDPTTDGDWYRPPAGTSWQWQLNGSLNTEYDVTVYDIDLFDNSEATIASLQGDDRKVICYFSAGSYEDFRDDAGQFPDEVLGDALDDFPDERWLDIRSEEVLDIMLARLDTAVEKGCDGVEPDNVDGFANDSGFDLTSDDQLLFNARIANAAHERNLSVGLKNDLDQIGDLADYFDFAVNEQCHEFEECDALQPFIDADKAVFSAEYDATFVNDASARSEICQESLDMGLTTLIMPVDLDDSFRLSCGD
jgi:hypothetical protein